MPLDHSICRVRTITTFITLGKDDSLWQESVQCANEHCIRLAKKLAEAGFQTQTIRVVTNPFGEYLDCSSLSSAKKGMAKIASILESLGGDLRMRFAIGEAVTKAEIDLLPDLISDYGDICNACVNFGATETFFVDEDLLETSALAVQQIAAKTPRGEGNFNFTVNFNCPSFIPYFPAGYHRGEQGNAYVVGLETPDLLVDALKALSPNLTFEARLSEGKEMMQSSLQQSIDQILNVVESFETDFAFLGIDSSAAPSKDCSSIVDVYRMLGVPRFGAAGTIAASSVLTSVFKSIKGVPLVGFSGLMLALTEDQGLANASIAGELDLTSLLANSAVCGIGLDTVPLPGSVTSSQLCRLFQDTATLAFRLNKPLTVRVFPVPGKQAGDMTEFQSADLCNCAVQTIA